MSLSFNSKYVILKLNFNNRYLINSVNAEQLTTWRLIPLEYIDSFKLSNKQTHSWYECYMPLDNIMEYTLISQTRSKLHWYDNISFLLFCRKHFSFYIEVICKINRVINTSWYATYIWRIVKRDVRSVCIPIYFVGGSSFRYVNCIHLCILADVQHYNPFRSCSCSLKVTQQMEQKLLAFGASEFTSPKIPVHVVSL